jgi:hypothetical protein
LSLFQNPVGFGRFDPLALAVFQAKALQNCLFRDKKLFQKLKF